MPTMSRKQLAQYYGCTIDTLRYYMNKHKKLKHLRKRRVFTPAEYMLIIDSLGPPQIVEFPESVKDWNYVNA
jgi:hypothetical protein